MIFNRMCLVGALLASVHADELKSIVRFSNNDQLSGQLESLSAESLIWRSPILERPTSFYLKSILDLNLAVEVPTQAAGHEAQLILTNGDTVSGKVTAISDETIQLETWFAGPLKFRRVMVKEIQINERPSFLYQGPSSLMDWTQSTDPPAWSLQNAAFISNAVGSIARDLKLPKECHISFNAAWRGAFGLKIILFSDQLKSESPGNGYEISFQQKAIYARSCKTGASLGAGVTAPTLQESQKAKIEVRASIKSGTVAIFINGEIVGTWTDPDVAQNNFGKGLHFVTINASPVRISQIGMATWDGLLDKTPEPAPPGGIRQLEGEDVVPEDSDSEKVLPSNRMILRNGDSIAGEVVAIAEDIITLKTVYKEVRIPVAVLKSMALKPAELERCKRENGDVRAWFSDGNSLVFRLERFNEKTISGSNQNFGTAEFQTAAFSRIEFNIYDRKLDELRDRNQW